MSEFTNNQTTNTVKSSIPANFNPHLTIKKQKIQTQQMKEQVMKTTTVLNESFDLHSNCFVLGYN